MGEVITSVEQVTPEWLTAVLDRAELSRPFGSLVSRLTVTYKGDVSARAPHRLFMKLADPDTHEKWPGRGKREVQFYNSIRQGDFARLPLPQCYDAAISDDGFHLLLDDLTESHIALPHPFPPSLEQCRQVITTLASIHAWWWNNEKLGVSMGRSPEQKTVFDGDEDFFPAFADFLGEALWPERRAIFERVIDAAPRLHKRLEKGNLTLIHGDAHAWNFLYPRGKLDYVGAKGAVLVDWETWDADVGVFDLAYLITLFWFPAHRARLEKELVQNYHFFLQTFGVRKYSFEDCWNDYRHSVIRLLLKPVWWCHAHPEDKFWPEVWWPRLERVLCAFEDLHCGELLT